MISHDTCIQEHRYEPKISNDIYIYNDIKDRRMTWRWYGDVLCGTWQPDGSPLWQAGFHNLLWKAEDIILLLRLLRRPAALLVGGTAFPQSLAWAISPRLCSRGFAIEAILAIFVISSSKVTNICELNILAVNCKWTLNSVEVREGMRRHASSLGHASNWRWKSHEPRLRAAAERRVL